MHYLFSTAFVAAMGLAAVQPAQAESPLGNDFYGSFSVGAAISTNDTGVGPGARTISDVESDPGLNLDGAIGGWIGKVYRSEFAIGYRTYDAEGAAYNMTTGLSDISAITLAWNNYFHVLEGHHQPYFGYGLGVGFWEFGGDAFADSYKTAFLGQLIAGYDFYLAGLPAQYLSMGGGLLENMTVGVAYRFSWSNPKPSSVGGPTIFNNDELQQTSHSLLFSARYEF